MDAVECSIMLPTLEVVVDRTLRREVFAQGAPLAARAEEIQRRYISPLTTSRMVTVRLLLPRFAGGISGQIRLHSSSVRSVG